MSTRARNIVSDLIAQRKQAEISLFQKHPHVEKWFTQKKLRPFDIRAHSARIVAGVTLSGALLLSNPLFSNAQIPLPTFLKQASVDSQDLQKLLSEIKTKNLSKDTEEEIIKAVEAQFDMPVAFELDGNRIPQSVGVIALEQHLPRFPADTIWQHGAFQDKGITGGRGAFGYFERKGVSKQQWEEEERYYLVLQTFLIPNWNQDWVHLKEWYAFRKFLVINVKTGKAVVTVLGDSGPGVSTGKHFGGSPETMAALGYIPLGHKGDVLVLFLDDPQNKIPLGPIPMEVARN